MATALQQRKKIFGSKARGGLARVKRAKSEEAHHSFEEMTGMKDACQGLGAIPALEGHPTAPLPSKGDGRFHLLWETEFQDFLEGSAWEEQLLEQMTPWANTRAFLAAFEQVALACRWPRKEWATRLLPSLNEEAEKAFLSLEPKDREDFWKVKAAILRREAAARERKHLEFRRFCYQEANGPHEVHARLQELCHQWLNAEKSTKEQILEALVLEQFLNVLPKEMQNWVKEHFPENCGQAIALAEDFLRKLQAAERGEEMETEEEPTLSHPKTQEVHLESVMTQIKAKRAVDEVSPFPIKAVPGYRKASAKKRGYVQWVQFGDTKLKAKFPGRANKVLPYYWKKAEDTTERRHSERLRRGHSLPLVKTPPSPPPAPSSPPSPKVKPKHKKPSSLQEASKDQIKNCPDCGRDFHGVASFARHRMRHTGEKRYECCFCGKGFSWRSDLVRHECIHTGKKLHECSFCGEGFDRKWQRMQHEKTHMRGKASL